MLKERQTPLSNRKTVKIANFELTFISKTKIYIFSDFTAKNFHFGLKFTFRGLFFNFQGVSFVERTEIPLPNRKKVISTKNMIFSNFENEFHLQISQNHKKIYRSI